MRSIHKFLLVSLALTSLSAMATVSASDCSPDLFPRDLGSGQDLSIPLALPTSEQSDLMVSEIIESATESTFGLGGCKPAHASCYGTRGQTHYGLGRQFDRFHRLQGMSGNLTTDIAMGITSYGWQYVVSESYNCSWGSNLATVCDHLCHLRTDDAPGS